RVGLAPGSSHAPRLPGISDSGSGCELLARTHESLVVTPTGAGPDSVMRKPALYISVSIYRASEIARPVRPTSFSVARRSASVGQMRLTGSATRHRPGRDARPPSVQSADARQHAAHTSAFAATAPAPSAR